MTAEKTAADNIIQTGPLGTPNPIDIYLGRRIREIREEAEISPKDFADRLGISYRLLDRFERGVKKIPASLLWYIAVLLEEDLDMFFKDILPSRANRRYKIPKQVPTFID
nr:MAG TPA: SOS-response transcriptional repressor [Caudoviricetes sp.]